MNRTEREQAVSLWTHRLAHLERAEESAHAAWKVSLVALAGAKARLSELQGDTSSWAYRQARAIADGDDRTAHQATLEIIAEIRRATSVAEEIAARFHEGASERGERV